MGVPTLATALIKVLARRGAWIASALAVGMIGLILAPVAAGIAGRIGSGLGKAGSLGTSLD